MMLLGGVYCCFRCARLKVNEEGNSNGKSYHHTRTPDFPTFNLMLMGGDTYCCRSVTPLQDGWVLPLRRATGFPHGGGVGARAGARGEAAKANARVGSIIAVQQYVSQQ